MRHIAVSVLSLFIALPAFADVRLPVVNLASGGISARAAFGEPIVAPVKNTPAPVSQAKNVASNISKKSEPAPIASGDVTRETNTVARATVATETVSTTPTHVDAGANIVASADVLAPRRPSSDLWAYNNRGESQIVPLRLPSPDEFSVIRSDSALPEESLDSASAQTRVASANVSVPAPAVARKPVESAPVAEPMSELDAQIARLNELQRRADASVNNDIMDAVDIDPVSHPAPAPRVAVAPATTPRVVSRGVVARPAVMRDTATRTAVAPTNIAASRNDASSMVAMAEPVASQRNVSGNDSDVHLSQMVVPMDDDVVVRAVERSTSPRIVSVRNDMTQMTPSELRRAFRKTFLSENKHLSTFQIDDRFDVASDMTANAQGFTAQPDLSESGGIRPLEIKIKFRNSDSALSRDNYNLLTEYAGIVLSNPTRAVQVSIPQSATENADDRKLAARRLAIVEQVLRDNGISEQRILPVLSQRDEEGLVLRMISLDQYETLTKRQRDIFGDTVSKKTYRSMSW